MVDALSNRIIYLHMDQEGDAPGISGTDGENPLLDARVREAISLAINREAIAERIMGGYAQPRASSCRPDVRHRGVRSPLRPGTRQELMAEAGYPDGFEIMLGTPNDRYINDEKVAQAIAQMLAQIISRCGSTPAPRASSSPAATTSSFRSTWRAGAQGRAKSHRHSFAGRDL